MLTGSLQPAAMLVTDAAVNLGTALMASQTLEPGVYVCMGGRAFPAGQVRKDALTGQFRSTSSDDVTGHEGTNGPAGAAVLA